MRSARSIAVEGSEAGRRYAFAETHRMFHQRISVFINLPVTSLDGFPVAVADQPQLPMPIKDAGC